MIRLARGVGKVALYYAQNPGQLLRPQHDVRCRTVFGATMYCSHENYIERAILTQGAFEPESSAATQRALRTGQVTFDIGANVGYYTLLLAACVGPTGQVHAFEPTEWAHTRCQQNLLLNPALAPVQLHRLGLLAEKRTRVEAIESRFSAKILARSQPEQLQFTTLDLYCSERGIDRIDFLKIDVDGYDYQVMRGGRAILARTRPTLLCELNQAALAAQGDSLAQYISLLDELGYTGGEVLDGPLRGRRDWAELLTIAKTSDVNANLLLQHPSTAPTSYLTTP